MHKASRSFWLRYRCLPDDIQQVAAKQFAILKTNPHHPSVRFKKLIEKNGREIWSARVTLKYRALAVKIRP
jgi:mRNA-degrading endonuclease RelE of RelBE toxin-antitoxin system